MTITHLLTAAIIRVDVNLSISVQCLLARPKPNEDIQTHDVHEDDIYDGFRHGPTETVPAIKQEVKRQLHCDWLTSLSS